VSSSAGTTKPSLSWGWLLLVPLFLTLLIAPRQDYVYLEVLFALATIAVCYVQARARPMRRAWLPVPPLWAACLLPALLSIALRLALLPWIPKPNPAVSDEFSHRFLAETLLAGRFANPPHPLWQHFESIHILQQPTYSSMYLFGHAAFLSAGKLLSGDFFGGVLLETALFCAVLVWFLYAYVPPRWAFYGGLIAAVRFGAVSYWNDSYWGGSAGALGGALVLGAYARLARRWSLFPAFLLAMGTVVLLNTRPFESLGILIPVGVILLWKVRANLSVAILIGVLALGAFTMTTHWKAVTGSRLVLPYQLNQQMYGWPMTLPWFHVRQIEFRHKDLQQYWDFERQEHRQITEPAWIPVGILTKMIVFWRFFIGAGLTAALLFAPRIIKIRRCRIPWITGASVLALAMIEQSGYPHYLSPIAAVIVLFVIQGLRYVSHWQWRGVPLGSAMARSAWIPMSLILAWRIYAGPTPLTGPDSYQYSSWCCQKTGAEERANVVAQLEAAPGQHLVFVDFDRPKFDTFEWVYNGPDIDTGKVIFARDMGQQKNMELIDYYPGRHFWRAVVKDKKATLLPY
jgi:hypothetical protein